VKRRVQFRLQPDLVAYIARVQAEHGHLSSWNAALAFILDRDRQQHPLPPRQQKKLRWSEGGVKVASKVDTL
jgi:hypothetical protein